MSQSFLLPWPPSVTGMWRAIKGRNVLSERYRLWRAAASKALVAQKPKPVIGPVRVTIVLSPPDARGFDLDSRVKPILELLAANRIIDGDGHLTVRELNVSAADGFGSGRLSGARITILPIELTRRDAA